jgi:hypothetical protein
VLHGPKDQSANPTSLLKPLALGLVIARIFAHTRDNATPEAAQFFKIFFD